MRNSERTENSVSDKEAKEKIVKRLRYINAGKTISYLSVSLLATVYEWINSTNQNQAKSICSGNATLLDSSVDSSGQFSSQVAPLFIAFAFGGFAVYSVFKNLGVVDEVELASEEYRETHTLVTQKLERLEIQGNQISIPEELLPSFKYIKEAKTLKQFNQITAVLFVALVTANQYTYELPYVTTLLTLIFGMEHVVIARRLREHSSTLKDITEKIYTVSDKVDKLEKEGLISEKVNAEAQRAELAVESSSHKRRVVQERRRNAELKQENDILQGDIDNLNKELDQLKSGVQRLIDKSHSKKEAYRREESWFGYIESGMNTLFKLVADEEIAEEQRKSSAPSRSRTQRR